MELSSHFLVLNLILILPFLPTNSAQFSFLFSRCGNATYTPNSTYQSNLKQVLNSLSSDTRITYGFYNFTAGHEPDKVEATALCRGDVPVGTCRVCVHDSVATLPVICANQKEAFGYTDHCIVFFSNGSIFHQIRERPRWTLRNNNNVSDIPGFNHTIYGLLGKLQNQAAKGDSHLKYATGTVVNVTGNMTLYGLVQCNPDLSRLDCLNCIQWLLAVFPSFVSMPGFIAAGERTICPSCNMRYEIYPFYDNVADTAFPPAPPPQSTPPSPPSNGGATTREVVKRKKSRTSIVIAISVVGSMALIITTFICILLRKKKRKKSSANFNKEEMDTLQSLQYSFGAIKVATENFSNDNKLGEGGFGTVYKGKLPDGQEVAVKRLSGNSGQGDAQFKNEILILAKLQHRNLVRLLGFCLEEEEMILIYEFVINRSLDNFIFDPVQRASMGWEARYRIIDGIARGLLYLHEDSRLRIIHRDLKGGNVLLDADFNPKIADFGMARLFNIDQTQAVASRIVGTYGYMPPEYVLHGNVSIKLDVFSFGVLVLEIISGQMISAFQIGENPENLLTFAWKNWIEGTPWNLVDPALSTAFSMEILRCIHIGLLCVQHNLADRPTMCSVSLMLSSDSLALQVPSQPAFFTRSHTPSEVPSQGNSQYQYSSIISADCSINEVSMTEPYPR